MVGIVLLLRDVLARSLFAKYQADFTMLNRILDAYEPAANRIANTVAVGFVQERERVIRQQQEAIRELSTPVLQVRERLLILPIIGVIDSQRARQLTEQLLRGIRTNRAKVVVIDITGVAAMDATVANHLVQTVEASRLLGATVIVTGLSPEIAQTLVNDRRRPGEDEHRRRPAGRHRGGRAAARLQGDAAGSGDAERCPVEVPILKQGEFLIATIQASLTDADLEQLRAALLQRVIKQPGPRGDRGRHGARRPRLLRLRTLREMAQMIRLRGAQTVIVGIQPEVAFAMVQLGLKFEDVATALDLEEGISYLTGEARTLS